MASKKTLEEYARCKLNEMKNWEGNYRKKMLKLLEKQRILLTPKNISSIIEATSFQALKNNPDASSCPYYKENKPCCNLEDLNCFLCPCPNYDLSFIQAQESPLQLLIGNCKIKNKKGKYSFHLHLKDIGIWDCSDCSYSHNPKFVEEYLRENIDGLKQKFD